MNYVKKGRVNMLTSCLIIAMLMSSLNVDSTDTTKGVSNTGDKAPTFYAKIYGGGGFFLSRMVGESSRLKDKSTLVLSFFTTSCIPCRAEIPLLHDLQEKYPDVKFYLVNIREPEKLCGAYIKKMGYTLPVLLDRHGKIAEKYKALVTPTLVIISKEGKISYYKQGYDGKFAEEVRLQLNKMFIREKK